MNVDENPTASNQTPNMRERSDSGDTVMVEADNDSNMDETAGSGADPTDSDNEVIVVAEDGDVIVRAKTESGEHLQFQVQSSKLRDYER